MGTNKEKTNRKEENDRKQRQFVQRQWATHTQPLWLSFPKRHARTHTHHYHLLQSRLPYWNLMFCKHSSALCIPVIWITWISQQIDDWLWCLKPHWWLKGSSKMNEFFVKIWYTCLCWQPHRRTFCGTGCVYFVTPVLWLGVSVHAFSLMLLFKWSPTYKMCLQLHPFNCEELWPRWVRHFIVKR